MNSPTRLPRPARWLLRIARIPPRVRTDVEADFLELFVNRVHDRGALHAHWRLYHDVWSLWVHRRAAWPTAADGQRQTFSQPTGFSASSAFVPSLRAILDDAHGDVRYAVRLFAKQPAILVLTIVGLSLGLGMATATFSIMNAATLRGEGLRDPDRAPGVLRLTDRSVSTTWSYAEFIQLRHGATRMQVEAVVSDVARVGRSTEDEESPSTTVGFVSAGFFAATGGRMAIGRAFDVADERFNGPPPVVISHALWTSRFQRGQGIVGRFIQVGRTEAVVIGIAEPGFSLPHSRQLWLPLTAYAAVYGGLTPASPVQRAPDSGLQLFGRLQRDVSIAEAEAELSGIAAGLPWDRRGDESLLRARLDSRAGLGRAALSDVVGITAFVAAVIGLVLLLACANVASVLVATAVTRERELGVRLALGASRSRIVRQLITESLALGLVASSLGLLFAYWAVPVIGRMIEAPAGTDLRPDLTVYVFLGAITLISGLGAGLAPAWHGRGADLVAPLKGEGAAPNRIAPRRLRFLLVMAQAAASVLLIVLAALFVRASVRAAAIDVGFDADGLYAVAPALGEASDDSGAALRHFWTRAVSELQAVPGVAGVTIAERTPFGDISRTALTRDVPARVVDFVGTQAEYFDTLGLAVLAGRTYTRDEVTARAPVAVISQSLARTFRPEGSALGQMLPAEIPVSSTRPVVIGIVADVVTARLYERNTLAVYEPLAHGSERFAQLILRVAPGAAGAIDHASQRLRAIDPHTDVRITSIAGRLQQETDRPRMLAILSGVVGVMAIVLCVIGLYGLTASVVGQRTREMGVRLAMGAAPRDLLRLLMWDSLKPVVFGLVVGAAAAIAAARVVMAVMFFGVPPQDPAALALAAGLLLAAAVAAVFSPTRRAAAVDPAIVLRQS
jgi:predicted permease